MDLPVVSADDLHERALGVIRDTDELMINTIVKQVYSQVIACSNAGLFASRWFADLYKYENVTTYNIHHVLIASNRLRKLFPGAQISTPTKLNQILVEWH
jgi:hypothetical protein